MLPLTHHLILHNINYAKLWMNSSNVPFCNLYNRKCDFSPLRAAWRPDFFVMGLCSTFALRHAGQLQAGTQDSWCLLPRAARQSAGAMLAVLRACRPAALACAVPGRRAGASVRLVVWPRNFGSDLPRLPRAGVFGWRRGPNCPCGPLRWI